MNNGENFVKISSYNWIIKLCINLLSYTTVLLPGCLIYKYVRYTKYIQRGGKQKNILINKNEKNMYIFFYLKL